MKLELNELSREDYDNIQRCIAAVQRDFHNTDNPQLLAEVYSGNKAAQALAYICASWEEYREYYQKEDCEDYDDEPCDGEEWKSA